MLASSETKLRAVPSGRGEREDMRALARLLCRPRLRVTTARGFLGLLLAAGPGCMVGPNFARPLPPTAATWIEADDAHVRTPPAEAIRWWEVFDDAALSRLVEMAYAQNLTLRAAGLRVLEAQARRGITIGNLFPQEQALSGAYTRARLSANTATPVLGGRDVNRWQAGFDASWELDFWGKFRRAVEAADADLLAAVADYDDVLVSLVAEVASTYTQIRVLDERLAVARDNVRVQEDSLRIAVVRFDAGSTSELDVQQATTLLRDTEATIPQLEFQRRQNADSLCVLLGIPPRDLTALLDGAGGVPQAPASVAVGIPAEVLERRPDVRSAEEAAAAQSARIGVAVAEWLPAVQLTGSVGLSAESVAKLFEGRAFAAAAGPAFTWPVLNYGRIRNNVRLQDATFQELVVTYANTVLRAQQEVEDALIGYLRGTEQVARLAEAVAAANRAVEISLVQYREGATDFTSVLTTQQSKLREADLLASNRGAVTLNVIALYKALGGGWQIRSGNDFIPADTQEEMRARGYWGPALSTAPRVRDIDAAQADAEPRHWWQWRWWWPKW
jgi:NodT family efflux transporter outer membrane factor (OMF) lipoprotein